MKKFSTFVSLLLVCGMTSAQTLDLVPHFLIQMQNRSDLDATISFSQGVGNVYLTPSLPDHTPLLANQTSPKYTVNFDPLLAEDTFNIIFTGKNDCVFNVDYFAPGDPKISMSGLGCSGGGYQIIDNGMTLQLFISDIRPSNKTS